MGSTVRPVLTWAGFLSLALLLLSCSGSTDGGPDTNGNVNPLWVYTEQFYYDGKAPSVDLRGEAYCDACPSPSWSESCGPFYSAPSSIDVLWQNQTSGTGGTTFHGIFSDCDHVYYQYYFTAYSHFWTATVPLQEGRNVIGITASGMGYSVTDTVSVYRDLTPPTAPENVSATAVSADRIDVAWDAASDDVGVSGYTVYRDGTYIWSAYYYRNMSDDGLSSGTTYCYTVLAWDAVGNESEPSGEVCATTPP